MLAKPDITPQEVATEVLRLGDEVERLGKSFSEHAEKQDGVVEAIYKRLDEIVSDLSKRPPLWVTAVIGVMSTIIGLLSGGLFFALNQIANYQHQISTLMSG